MCGRYTQYATWDELVGYFRLIGTPQNVQARYNIAPTQTAPIIRPAGNRRELVMMRWWLVPSWSKRPDTKFKMFNARSDRLQKSGAYRGPFKTQRCLVPATGWYEWKTENGAKQPYYISRAGGGLLAFAGLWDHWDGDDEHEPINSFTIITTDANEALSTIHHRMPVVLELADFNAWLACRADTEVLQPAPEDLLTFRAVSKDVNNSRNEGSELIDVLQD